MKALQGILGRMLVRLFASALVTFYVLVTVLFPVTAFAQTAQGSLTANPFTGTAPLTVTFTGSGGGATYFGGVQISFGDGNVASFCGPGSACSTHTTTHAYSTPGAYTAKLISSAEGTTKTLATTQVTVKAPASTTSKPTCFITVNPTSIPVGGSITVKWSSTNATGGAITNIGNVGPSGSINLLPSSAATTMYAGSFTGPTGTANCQATVAVVTSSGIGGTGATGGTGTTGSVPPTVVTPTPSLPSASTGSSGLVPCGYGAFQPSSNSASSSTGCQACNLAQLIQNVITFAIGLSIPIAAALFAWAGVLFFTSADSPGRRDDAKKIFKNAVVGFLIAITAWIVINTVLQVIFSGNPSMNGNWFTIKCADQTRPVNNSITSVLNQLPVVGGGTIATDGTPGSTGGLGSGTSGGGGGGTSAYDAAENALVEQCATGSNQGSCDALDSIASNNNKLTDSVDEALSTNCDNGIQSSCDALLRITGNPDQAQGARGASGSSIYAAALEYRGTDTSAGPNCDGGSGGQCACAWAVNNVLSKDGVAPIDGSSVFAMETELRNGRGTPVQTSDAQEGDIIIWKQGAVSHVGICENAGCSSALSNSSANASFTNVSGSTLRGVAGRVYRVNQ